LGKPLRYLGPVSLAGFDGIGRLFGAKASICRQKTKFLSATGWTIVEDVLRQSWAQMTVAGTMLGD
jgi:hypothetical protein